MTEKLPSQMTDDEIREWCTQSYQGAVSFLAQEGIITESVVLEESSYLPPIVAFWKIKSSENEFYWVVNDEIKADFIPASAAKTARDAAKVFSLRWQLEVEKVTALENIEDKVLQEAKELEFVATRLYQIHEEDELWG